MTSSEPGGLRTRTRRAIAVSLGVMLVLSVLSAPAPASGGRTTYRDPDDTRGNLDVLTITGSREHSARYGVVFRTTLTMEDEWLDEDADIEFYFNEVGAEFPRGCGDDCSGDYYGWLHYDESAREIHATGYEAVNCDCVNVEWPAGRSDEHSVWFGIPQSWFYDGTYAYEVKFVTRSPRQTEPAPLPVCIVTCSDTVDLITFPVSSRS